MTEMQISPLFFIESVCNIYFNTKKYPGSVEIGSIRGKERKEDFDFFVGTLGDVQGQLRINTWKFMHKVYSSDLLYKKCNNLGTNYVKYYIICWSGRGITLFVEVEVRG